MVKFVFSFLFCLITSTIERIAFQNFFEGISCWQCDSRRESWCGRNFQAAQGSIKKFICKTNFSCAIHVENYNSAGSLINILTFIFIK